MRNMPVQVPYYGQPFSTPYQVQRPPMPYPSMPFASIPQNFRGQPQRVNLRQPPSANYGMQPVYPMGNRSNPKNSYPPPFAEKSNGDTTFIELLHWEITNGQMWKKSVTDLLKKRIDPIFDPNLSNKNTDFIIGKIIEEIDDILLKDGSGAAVHRCVQFLTNPNELKGKVNEIESFKGK